MSLIQNDNSGNRQPPSTQRPMVIGVESHSYFCPGRERTEVHPIPVKTRDLLAVHINMAMPFACDMCHAGILGRKAEVLDGEMELPTRIRIWADFKSDERSLELYLILGDAA